MKNVHADAFKVSAGPENISLLFGARQPAGGVEGSIRLPVSDQIVLTPKLARELYERLGNALAEQALFQSGGPQAVVSSSAPHALPFSSRIGGGSQKAQQLLDRMDALGVRYGLEHSYKFLAKTLLRNRFLAGFKLGSSGASLYEPLFDLCSRLDMPPKFIGDFQADIGAANIVLFGFEENENTCLYKAYLEFGGNFRFMSLDNPETFRIHKGFKWDAFDNGKASVATYTCYPLLSTKAITDRLEEFYGDGRERLFMIARKIIARAAERVGDYEFIYAEVHEDGNPRHSFDINVYRANMRVNELHDILLEISGYYLVPVEEFDAAYGAAQDQIFGHLSGGIDRQGRDFLTIYFGAFGSSS